MMPISCKYFPADAINLLPTPMNNQGTLSLHVTYDKMKMHAGASLPPSSAALNTATRIFHIRLRPAFSEIIRRCFSLRRCYAASPKAVLNNVLQSRQTPTLSRFGLSGKPCKIFSRGTAQKLNVTDSDAATYPALSLPLCTRSAQAATCPHIARYLPCSENSCSVSIKKCKKNEKEK